MNLFIFLSLLSFSLAHNEPHTEQEIEAQRAMQAAAYYVRDPAQ